MCKNSCHLLEDQSSNWQLCICENQTYHYIGDVSDLKLWDAVEM